MIVAQLVSCSSARKTSERRQGQSKQGWQIPMSMPSPETMGPPELYGPEDPAPGPSQQPVYGPDPIEMRPVTLVLGPGLARGFAFAGAIRALSDAKVPIGMIVGTEMGALVGALYALDSNANHLEWQLQKFREGVFLSERDFIPTHRFDSELEQVFSDRSIQQSKIPLRIGFELTPERRWILADQGSVREALRAAMATPELFGPGKWAGTDAVAASKSRPYPIAEARKLSAGPVIVIDVLDPKDTASFPELKDADLVIHPEMKGIGRMDFSKKTEAAFRGKKAVLEKLAEIKHWVGMPQGEP